MSRFQERAAAHEREHAAAVDAVERARGLAFADLERAAVAGTLRDDLNPAYLFATTAPALLAAVAAGRVDVVAVARYELTRRRLDPTGRVRREDAAEEPPTPRTPCPECGEPSLPGYVTCGRSTCQESAYKAHAARARRGRRARVQ